MIWLILKCWQWWQLLIWPILSAQVAALNTNQTVPAQNHSNELSVGCADRIHRLQGRGRTSTGNMWVRLPLWTIPLGHAPAVGAAKPNAESSRRRVVVSEEHRGLGQQQFVQDIGREVKTVGRPLAHCHGRVAPLSLVLDAAGRSEVVRLITAVWVEAFGKPLWHLVLARLRSWWLLPGLGP